MQAPGSPDPQPPPDQYEPPEVTFEFELPPGEADRLLRAPAIAARREGRIRTTSYQTVWHDTATAELAAAGLSLAESSAGWRLERLRPDGATAWHPATPAPLIEAASDAAGLSKSIPGHLVAVAAFSGRQRIAPLAGPASLTILEGTLRGVATDSPACRILLTGTAPDMANLAIELASSFTLTVPRAGLAAEAMAVASGMAPHPRRTGTARVQPGASVEEALVGITAYLADVILHWSRLAPAGDTPEAVHQMRVAVRRLRSAISVFRRAAGPSLDTLGVQLRDLANTLGPARDWDVFTGGTGAAVGRAFAGERRVEALLTAAERRRRDAYSALAATLATPDFRRLALTLATLPNVRPWMEQTPEPGLLQDNARTYAARMLDRRLRHVTAPGNSLAALPAEALHDVRKQAKRLRYASEFFAPLFAEKPVRRFLGRLEQLQEALGALNDAAVTKTLLAQLGSGSDRAFASGVVQGFVAAQSVKTGAEVEHVWGKFRRQDVFWK